MAGAGLSASEGGPGSHSQIAKSNHEAILAPQRYLPAHSGVHCCRTGDSEDDATQQDRTQVFHGNHCLPLARKPLASENQLQAASTRQSTALPTTVRGFAFRVPPPKCPAGLCKSVRSARLRGGCDVEATGNRAKPRALKRRALSWTWARFADRRHRISDCTFRQLVLEDMPALVDYPAGVASNGSTVHTNGDMHAHQAPVVDRFWRGTGRNRPSRQPADALAIRNIGSDRCAVTSSATTSSAVGKPIQPARCPMSPTVNRFSTCCTSGWAAAIS